MENVEIRGKITSDATQAVKSTNEYIDALKAAKKAVNEAKIGSLEHKKAQEQLAVATKDLDRAVVSSGGSFSKLKETLGSTVPGFRSAQTGAEGLNSKMWELVKNPVGLIIAGIVLGLGFLFKSFTSTAEGGKKFEQALAGIKAVIQVVLDRAYALGNAVIKLLSGDFAGAAADAKAAVSGVGDAIANIYTKTAAITKRLQELQREQYADDLDKAKREKRLAQLREELNDETVSVAKKIKIAKELRDDQKKNAVDDYKRTKEIAELKIQLLEQEKDGAIKNEAEITELKKSIVQTDTENSMEGIRTNRVINNLKRQQNANDLADHKAHVDAKKAIDEKANKDYLDGIEKRRAAEKIINDEKWGAEKFGQDLKQMGADEAQKISDEEMARGSFEMQLLEANYKTKEELAKTEVANKWALAHAISSIASTLSEELGKNTVQGKALAIAGALIDTYAAIVATLKSAAKTPMGGIPGYAIAQSIATGITGLATVKKIISVQVPGGKGGGGGSAPAMPSFNTPAPLSPTQGSTALNAGSIQGIGNAAAGGTSRSFILESDITNNRERAERLNRASRLG